MQDNNNKQFDVCESTRIVIHNVLEWFYLYYNDLNVITKIHSNIFNLSLHKVEETVHNFINTLLTLDLKKCTFILFEEWIKGKKRRK